MDERRAAVRFWWRMALGALLGLVCSASAWAHVGNKDVYQTVQVGPYRLFVTIRTPLVIPGVAAVEVRSSGAAVTRLTVTPLPLTGVGSKYPPTADVMKVSAADPQFFTGSLWLMESGSSQVRFGIEGAGGRAEASVPVPAVAIAVRRMQKPLGIMLGALGCILVLGVVGIVTAGVREAQLAPGVDAGRTQRRRSMAAGAAAFVLCVAGLYLGGKWWNVEAAGYAGYIHRNSELRPSLQGDELRLVIGDPDKKAAGGWDAVENDDLLTDHGHLMHLYVIRWPEMDVVFHLHPVPTGKSGFSLMLPAMPAGTYHLYGDVVFRNGFPETETATVKIPAGMNGGPLDGEDASATPPPISAGELGTTYKLPDGYTMVWNRPAVLRANTPYEIEFRLLDPQGRPAQDMQRYLGMAGHAAFVKTDGTAFAHTHPEGSAAMPAVMLAEESTGMTMGGMDAMPGMGMSNEPVTSTVDFPYGFPSAGKYRVFVQMKHAGVVETGVFDTRVE